MQHEMQHEKMPRRVRLRGVRLLGRFRKRAFKQRALCDVVSGHVPLAVRLYGLTRSQRILLLSAWPGMLISSMEPSPSRS